MFNTQKHPYHIVNISPWPFLISISLFFFTFGNVLYFHNYKGAQLLIFISIFLILNIFYTWNRDIVRESTFEGYHTKQVQQGLKFGMLLFILSEIMFFFSFFWAFFHSSLAPVVELGSLWPPLNIVTLSPWEIPLFNTIILLSSGATVTWAHHSIIAGKSYNSNISLIYTIILAVFFLLFQIFEYYQTSFSISDSIYGSVFFLLTGFHGFHVLIGMIFLFICFIRLLNSQFTKQHHFGFEAASWYWHFVDVVWLFLFIVVYWWGGI